MSLSWHLVRNHERGQMRTGAEIGADLDASIVQFESASNQIVDDLLKEELGAGPWLALGEAPTNYSHPVVRIEAHGSLTLLALAVPSSLHNGIADFTNVLMLAHPNALLTVIRDPHGTYAADFGGRLIADFNQYQKGERQFTAGEAVFRATRSCVLSLEASLSTLRATVNPCFVRLRAIELREQRIGSGLDELEAEFGKTLAELRALVRTPSQLHRICNRIEEWSIADDQGGLFSGKLSRQSAFLRIKVDQVDAILGTFIAEIERAIKRCDDVSKRELLDAQRNNTYWTSALLLPNLIFAFFGQSFLGDANDSAAFWWISGLVLMLYGVGSAYFLLTRLRHRPIKKS
jgi:hypothetical protein